MGASNDRSAESRYDAAVSSATRNILASLRLARIGLVLTAVSNIWLVVFLTDGLPGQAATGVIGRLTLASLLGCTAVVAIGLYVFGMVLNDLMDVRRDRTFAPGRPLPTGQLSTKTAMAIALLALLAAVGASVALGPLSTVGCVIAAALIVFYDAFGKHLPGVGIVTLGMIRAVHMLIANPALGLLWPVWLTMTHVVAISAAAHRLENKRPRLATRNVWIIVGGWMFASFAMAMWMSRRGGLMPPTGWVWIGPAVAVVAFLIVAMSTVERHDPKTAGQRLIKHGLIWLIVYDAAWLMSAGLWWQGLVIGAMVPVTFGVMAAMRTASAAAPEADFERE